MKIDSCPRCKSEHYLFYGIPSYQMEGYLYTIQCQECGNWEPFKTYYPRDDEVFTEDAAKVWNVTN